jgi:hypothetical protein
MVMASRFLAELLFRYSPSIFIPSEMEKQDKTGSTRLIQFDSRNAFQIYCIVEKFFLLCNWVTAKVRL